MKNMDKDFSFLELPVDKAAQRLLGCELQTEIGGELVRVRIVETEAYDQEDAASHSYRGQTELTKVMFGQPGHLYVYFTYGMHYCANVVVGPEGRGAAVLIRAVEPIEGVNILEARRSKTGVDVTNGPAKLCQALGINKDLNGHDLSRAPLRLVARPPLKSSDIIATKRIGISKAVDVLWRFYERGNPYVSR